MIPADILRNSYYASSNDQSFGKTLMMPKRFLDSETTNMHAKFLMN